MNFSETIEYDVPRIAKLRADFIAAAKVDGREITVGNFTAQKKRRGPISTLAALFNNDWGEKWSTQLPMIDKQVIDLKNGKMTDVIMSAPGLSQEKMILVLADMAAKAKVTEGERKDAFINALEKKLHEVKMVKKMYPLPTVKLTSPQ